MGKKIMLVDDNDYVRTELKLLLESMGHEIVAETKLGKKAAELFRESSPEATFVDLMMVDKSGLAVIKDLLYLDKSAYVIAMSASDNENLVLKTLLEGAIMYLIKPITKEKITKALEF